MYVGSVRSTICLPDRNWVRSDLRSSLQIYPFTVSTKDQRNAGNGAKQIRVLISPQGMCPANRGLCTLVYKVRLLSPPLYMNAGELDGVLDLESRDSCSFIYCHLLPSTPLLEELLKVFHII